MIIAAGDSFVYGSELPSQEYTYSYLLGATENIAWPGIGNDGIARRTIDRCQTGTVNGVLVSWTFPGRYEFRFAYDTRQKTGNWYSITPWTTQSPEKMELEFISSNHEILQHHVDTANRARQTGVAEFADIYYRHVGSTEYWEIYSSLKEIVYLQNYLKLNKIPYMFTCADNSIVFNYTMNTGDNTINALYRQLDFSRWFWFPKGSGHSETLQPRGFYQWAVENKYPIGTTHPLELAHEHAAKLMEEQFNELVKKNLE